ncbi:hypothetical protein N7540_012958, partial [Penicillium herquei]
TQCASRLQHLPPIDPTACSYRLFLPPSLPPVPTACPYRLILPLFPTACVLTACSLPPVTRTRRSIGMEIVKGWLSNPRKYLLGSDNFQITSLKAVGQSSLLAVTLCQKLMSFINLDVISEDFLIEVATKFLEAKGVYFKKSNYIDAQTDLL